MYFYDVSTLFLSPETFILQSLAEMQNRPNKVLPFFLPKSMCPWKSFIAKLDNSFRQVKFMIVFTREYVTSQFPTIKKLKNKQFSKKIRMESNSVHDHENRNYIERNLLSRYSGSQKLRHGHLIRMLWPYFQTLKNIRNTARKALRLFWLNAKHSEVS